MTTTEKRLPMSPSEAKAFSRYSLANASAVEGALQCGCKAYEDVFTYARWRALGYQVQRGEKSIRIPVIVNTSDTENEDTGEVKPGRRMLWTGHVFCRHQVAPLGGVAAVKPS